MSTFLFHRTDQAHIHVVLELESYWASIHSCSMSMPIYVTRWFLGSIVIYTVCGLKHFKDWNDITKKTFYSMFAKKKKKPIRAESTWSGVSISEQDEDGGRALSGVSFNHIHPFQHCIIDVCGWNEDHGHVIYQCSLEQRRQKKGSYYYLYIIYNSFKYNSHTGNIHVTCYAY